MRSFHSFLLVLGETAIGGIDCACAPAYIQQAITYKIPYLQNKHCIFGPSVCRETQDIQSVPLMAVSHVHQVPVFRLASPTPHSTITDRTKKSKNITWKTTHKENNTALHHHSEAGRFRKVKTQKTNDGHRNHHS